MTSSLDVLMVCRDVVSLQLCYNELSSRAGYKEEVPDLCQTCYESFDWQ